MKKISIIALVAIVSLTGCRREDWREVTISSPGLAQTNSPAVAAALSRYEGVDISSLKFDFEKKEIFLRYDSMKVAQTNLRMAIEAKGVEVSYPENPTPYAGYLNERTGEKQGAGANKNE